MQGLAQHRLLLQLLQHSRLFTACAVSKRMLAAAQIGKVAQRGVLHCQRYLTTLETWTLQGRKWLRQEVAQIL